MELSSDKISDEILQDKAIDGHRILSGIVEEVFDSLDVLGMLHMTHSDASFWWHVSQEIGIELLVCGHALDWGLTRGVREGRVAIFIVQSCDFYSVRVLHSAV